MAKKKQPKVDPKVSQAQYKNKYMRQMEQVYSQIHPDLFPTITRQQRDILYSIRGTAIRTFSEESAAGWLLEYCDECIRRYLRNTKLDIIPGKLKMSCLDYSTYIFPLEAWAEQMAPQFEGKEWYTEIILNNKDKRINYYSVLMEAIAASMMYQLTHHAYAVYHIEYKIIQDCRVNGSPRINQMFMLKGCNPRRATIKFSNNEVRYAIEVLYNYPKSENPDNIKPFTPLTIPLSRFDMNKEGVEDKPLPVFILRHALNRLEERMGCLVYGFVEAEIVNSMLHGGIYYTPDKSILVEFLLNGKKAGYLQVAIDEDAILIRTFLFLTNASTPEGQKLRIHMGLKKEDIKYFKIDKLTPFLETDLLTDKKMVQLLRDAGCESLIELCESLKDSQYWKSSEEKKALAAKLRKYMQQDNEEEEETCD